MRSYTSIVNALYRHVTEKLGVRNARVGYGGLYAYVVCKRQDEYHVRQALDGCWHGVGVIVRIYKG